jgi:predicted enzyme related to lactoylglutathione lyase
MAKVLGMGGIFFKATDPGKLAAWYAKWLGLDVKEWGGVQFFAKRLPDSAYSVWSPFEATTCYFRPSKKPFMVNFMVDDVDSILGRIARSGAKVVPERDESEFGGSAGSSTRKATRWSSGRCQAPGLKPIENTAAGNGPPHDIGPPSNMA